MIQQARWHISCDRVFRMRSIIVRYNVNGHSLVTSTCLWSPGSWSQAQSNSSAPLPWILVVTTGKLNERLEARRKEPFGTKNAPMPSGTTSSSQQAIAPGQSRLDRKTGREDGLIEFVKERLRVRGALRLFRLRQCLFRRPRCSRSFRRRRFGLRVYWRLWDCSGVWCAREPSGVVGRHCYQRPRRASSPSLDP
jgi:hypothetical protein